MAAVTVAFGGRRWQRRLALLAVAVFAALLAPGLAHADVFTVFTTADSGPGSLRAAIDGANAHANPAPGSDEIHFAIAGLPPYQLQLQSPLPALTDPVVVDGTTQCLLCAGPVVEIRPTQPALNAGFGLTLATSDSTIRDLAIVGFLVDVSIAPNPSGNTAIGRNTIERNYIGIDTTGSPPTSNAERGQDAVSIIVNCGFVVCSNSDNVVRNNVIGGISDDAIAILNSSGNTIVGNRIGTNPAGTEILPGPSAAPEFRPDRGIEINRGDDTIIGSTNATPGGACSGDCNLIAGFGTGILQVSGAGTTIKGNFVGVDLTGQCALDGLTCTMKNTRDVQLAADRAVVGGLTAAERNVLGNGVAIEGGSGITIRGNFIGTDASGTSALVPASASVGIAVNGGAGPVGDVQIGGTAGADTPDCDGACNLTSGLSTGVAIACDVTRCHNVRVEGNFIGTDVHGTGDLGNLGAGVGPLHGGFGPSGGYTVGGVDSAKRNLIAFNGTGVAVTGDGTSRPDGTCPYPTCLGVAILSNSIHDNDGPGIILHPGNVPNDPGDPDSGVNDLQNSPVVSSAAAGGGQTTIAYSLNSRSGTRYRIEFFANDACDSSGFGEGEKLIGSRDIVTDGSGNLGETASFPTPAGGGSVITATATDVVANNTSEFSACTRVSASTAATLIVEKQTLPDGDATTFGFSGAASGSISDGQTLTVAGLAAGTYQATETLPNGWDIASIACDDRDSSGDPASKTATFRLGAGEIVRCMFTDAKRGTIVVKKRTDPVGSVGTFSFSGSASGSIGDGGEIVVSNLPSNRAYNATGVYTSTEANPTPNFDLTSISCDETTTLTASSGDRSNRTATFRLDPGEIATCTFTNTKRGQATVRKTVSGSPLTALLPPDQQSFTFQLRRGASTTNAGTLLEQQDATVANGGVFTFATKLVAGDTYQLCEIVLPGWRTTLTTPFVLYNASGDNSTLCMNFSVGAGETKPIAVDNRPPPRGLARTIGFWKNWASCASSSGKQKPVLDQTLAAAEPAGITIGTLILHGSTSTPNTAPDCLKAVRLLDKSTIDAAKKMSSDPAFNLAAQLLAADLNVKAGALTCPSAISAINDAQTLLAAVHFNGITHDKLNAAQSTQANSLATTLDRYNNNLLCQ